MRSLTITTWVGALLIIGLAALGAHDAWERHATEARDLRVLRSLKVEAIPVWDVPPDLAELNDWVRFTGDLPQDAFALVSIVFVIDGRPYNARYFTLTAQDIKEQAAFPVMPGGGRAIYGAASIRVKFVYHGHELNYGEIAINTGGRQ